MWALWRPSEASTEPSQQPPDANDVTLKNVVQQNNWTSDATSVNLAQGFAVSCFFLVPSCDAGYFTEHS